MSNLIDSHIDKLEDLIYSNVTAPLDNKMLTILKPFLRSSLLLISEEVKKEAKRELFNDLWDSSVGKTKDDLEAAMLLFRRLNELRDSLGGT